MPIRNSDISGILDRLADLLEIDGANAFRIRAYREAAGTIEGLPRRVAEMLDEGEDLSSLLKMPDFRRFAGAGPGANQPRPARDGWAKIGIWTRQVISRRA